MRKSLVIPVLLIVSSPALAQEPTPATQLRYGVLVAPEAYPQRTPREALLSAVRAVERGKYEYLVAHIIDPKFIDSRVLARARLIEEDVERELRAERDAQRLNPPQSRPLPVEPALFATVVQQTAQERAFRQVVGDIRDTLAENPDHLKDFRRFARDGVIVDSGDTSSGSLRGVKDRQVFFRKEGNRWFIEDRQKPDSGNKK